MRVLIKIYSLLNYFEFIIRVSVAKLLPQIAHLPPSISPAFRSAWNGRTIKGRTAIIFFLS